MSAPRQHPQNIFPKAPPGTLLKRTRETRAARARTPRALDADHLAAIRQLPCLKCGVEPCGEAAHVRMNSGLLNKRQAMGQKPDDKWSVPLCAGCHREDPDAQHKIGEALFWERLGISPLLAAQELYRATGDLPRMRAVAFTFIAFRKTTL